MNSHSMRAGNSTVPTSVWCAEVAGVCIIPSAQFTPATQLDSWVAPSRRCELSLTNRRPPTKALSLPHAANRTSRLFVVKEVHLPCTSFLESILETVYGLSINILLWQIIPSIDDPLGKEVQTWIAVTMLLRQFPSVPSGWSVFGLFGKMWPRSGWQFLHHFE